MPRLSSAQGRLNHDPGFHLSCDENLSEGWGPPLAMIVEEKRQILYATLLRYSPETGSLRERALDRLVLVSLLESSQSNPIRIGTIQTLTRVVPGSPGLRTNVIQETLDRLTSHNRVAHTLLRTKHAYYLTDTGRNDTDEAAESAGQLFEPVLARMLQDTSALCDERDGAFVCRKFVSECFARFGQQIARAVTGELTKNALIEVVDVRGAFHAAISSLSLSNEAIESLEVRCNRFLRSTERADEELKFRLTQGYYVAQLLGLSADKFNPMADDAFREAVFYIDTNVLVGRLLSDETARLFDELVRISKILGIELRVSRATINEARWVAAGRLKGLENVIAKVPSELVKRTRDPFLDAFLELRRGDPEVTPAEFLTRFDEIPELLDKLDIGLHDRTAEEIVDDRDVNLECEVINQAAEKTRGGRKSYRVCLHDVCHYILVHDERTHGRKAWFLTRDKTLSQAAVDLGGEQPPFCFPLVGFLQSVSPFLEAPDTHRSLVDLFSAVLDGEVGDLSGESLFELSELKLISELHSDVFSTPVDQLVPAFDYVKSKIIGNKLYQRDDHARVALELKKFLTSSTEEKQKALHAEVFRQKKEAAAERAMREIAQKNAREKESEVSRLEAEVQQAGKRQVADARMGRRLSAGLAGLGALLAASVWTFDSELVATILEVLSPGGGFDVPLGHGVRFVGAVVLIGSFFPAVRLLKSTYRMGALAVVIAFAVGGADLIGLPLVARISGYLAIGTPIALALMIILEWSRVVSQDET